MITAILLVIAFLLVGVLHNLGQIIKSLNQIGQIVGVIHDRLYDRDHPD